MDNNVIPLKPNLNRCAIVFEDNPDGQTVNMKCWPSPQELLAMWKEGRPMTAAHGYMLKAINSCRELHEGNDPNSAKNQLDQQTRAEIDKMLFKKQ